MGLTRFFSRFAGSELLDEGADVACNSLFDFSVNFLKVAPDGAPGTATVNQYIWTNPFDVNVALVAARAVAIGSPIAQDPTNYAVITLQADDGLGGAPAAVLRASSQTGDGGTFLANVARLLGLVLTPTPPPYIVPGASLYLNIAKLGAGVTVPAAGLSLRLRKLS